MTSGYLTPASRRRLRAGVALLGASPHPAAAGPGPGTPANPSISPAPGAPDRLDGPLLSAAAAFCVIEQRMLTLIEGPERVADDDARDRLLTPLRDEQRPHLDALCRQRARSLAGHRARAVAFTLWDGGELAHRAQAHGFLEDRLLSALVRDLAAASW